jgi:amidase
VESTGVMIIYLGRLPDAGQIAALKYQSGRDALRPGSLGEGRPAGDHGKGDPMSAIRVGGRRRAGLAAAAIACMSLATAVAVDTPASASGGSAAPSASVSCSGSRTVLQLQADMARGALSSAALTSCYLDRIAATNDELHAVIQTFTLTARLEAAASDARRRAGVVPRSALEGVPILVKDNVDTSGPANQKTTAGSLALDQASTPGDAVVAAKLRAAGAVILGKANLSEWAEFRSLPGSAGWSAEGGQTRNPFGLNRSPCGSSSGSAAAVVAGLAAVTIGTQTTSSIVCPSGQDGAVGIKPTRGLVSNAGVVPISFGMDIPGPIARSVTDAAVVLGVIQGIDWTDPGDISTPRTAQVLAATQRNYLTAITDPAQRAAAPLAGKYIGVWSGVGSNADVSAVLAQSVATLTAMGAQVVDVDSFFPAATMNQLSADTATKLLNEFKNNIATYLATRGGTHPSDLQGLIDFDNAHASTELGVLGGNQLIFDTSNTFSGDLSDPAYLAASDAVLAAGRSMIDGAIANAVPGHRLSAIIAPSNGPANKIDLVSGDNFAQKVDSSLPASAAGYPAISVPAGFACNNQLPVGLTFFGTAFSEPTLIGAGYAFEQRTDEFRSPPLTPVVTCPTD